MRFDKKTIIGTSGVLVFALLLGCSSFSISNNMIDMDNNPLSKNYSNLLHTCEACCASRIQARTSQAVLNSSTR